MAGRRIKGGRWGREEEDDGRRRRKRRRRSQWV